jgi:hypothetical protein
MNTFLRAALLVPVLGLAACVAVPPGPPGPSAASLPGRGKSLDQFRADDVDCRNYASAQVGGMTPEEAAAQSGVGSAVPGAAIGGSSHGAAVGAGVGLVAGTAAGAPAAHASAHNVQRRYDISYRQCMYAKGHKVPAARRYAAPPPGEPYYAPPPPPYR